MQRQLAPALTGSEWADLELLRSVQLHAPDWMTDVSWAKLRELEGRLRWRQAFLRLLQTRRWSRGLTRQRIAELDRKTAAGESLNETEAMEWATVVRRYHDLAFKVDYPDSWHDEQIENLVSFDDDATAISRCGLDMRSRPSTARRRSSKRGARSPGRSSAADDGPHEHDLAILAWAVSS